MLIKQKLSSNLGFTLVELLVVIVIIGVSAGAVSLQIAKSPLEKARDDVRKKDINMIADTYLANATSANQFLPLEDGDLTVGRVPKPPEGGSYQGLLTEPQEYFFVCASLEKGKDLNCLLNSENPNCYCRKSKDAPVPTPIASVQPTSTPIGVGSTSPQPTPTPTVTPTPLASASCNKPAVVSWEGIDGTWCLDTDGSNERTVGYCLDNTTCSQIDDYCSNAQTAADVGCSWQFNGSGQRINVKCAPPSLIAYYDCPSRTGLAYCSGGACSSVPSITPSSTPIGIGSTSPQPTSTPNPSSTSSPTPTLTPTPTPMVTSTPTSQPTSAPVYSDICPYQSVPQVKPEIVSMEGIDGSWCFDSDNALYSTGYLPAIRTAGYCIDNNHNCADFCENNYPQDSLRDGYCTGNWWGAFWTNVHCEVGGYVCTSFGEACNEGSNQAYCDVNAAPLPSPTPLPQSIASKKVFKTSTVYNGNLGGIAGADQKCQARATAANLSGTWKAWLSDGTTSPSVRFEHFTGFYKLLDGTKVADNWTDLTDGTLDRNINMNEFGQINYQNTVWTGTTPQGNSTGKNCFNWTSSSGWPIFGGLGSGDSTLSYWTQGASDSTVCSDGYLGLYCFEQ